MDIFYVFVKKFVQVNPWENDDEDDDDFYVCGH